MKFTSNSVTVTYNYKVSCIDNKKKSGNDLSKHAAGTCSLYKYSYKIQ